MSAPTPNTQRVAQALARLTSRYGDPAQTPVVYGMVKVLAQRFQEIDSDYWSLLNGTVLDNHPMAGGPWAILDQIGAIVGEPRQGRDDAAYVPAIRLRIRINNSNGLAEDIIQIGALLVTSPSYAEWPPAAWELGAFGISVSTALALVTYLGQAKAAATAGNIRFMTDAGPYWILDDSVAGSVGATTLGDSVGGSTSELVSLQAVIDS